MYGFQKFFDVVSENVECFFRFGIMCLYMVPLTPTVMVTREYFFPSFCFMTPISG